MDSFNPFNQKPKSKKNAHPENLVEALKDVGSSMKQQAKDVVFGVNTPKDQNENSPEEAFKFEDYLKSREKQIAQQQEQKFKRRLEQERLVFHRKEEKVKLQIKAVQNELKKLAEATGGLSVEIQKATFIATVEPGTYHESFFDRIRGLIELARKKVAESKTWLEAFNHRGQKCSHYWGQVKKSGSKFMLSQERSLATQVG